MINTLPAYQLFCLNPLQPILFVRFRKSNILRENYLILCRSKKFFFFFFGALINFQEFKPEKKKKKKLKGKGILESQ